MNIYYVVYGERNEDLSYKSPLMIYETYKGIKLHVRLRCAAGRYTEVFKVRGDQMRMMYPVREGVKW